MSPSVTRLLRWAAVVGAGIALTLALWQDPVLADGVAPPAIRTRPPRHRSRSLPRPLST
ncbi:hypothetical protein [Micromonospora sp. 4G55]|uniref:hypothetical protein n=1 Tax=Micromonospora sp. 4G55 TaxID=2806102 RepID=UPI001A41DD4C|nr:hypothetical protein [Micromonospora sp. 4G55]MBM0259101.1 hypothetical protein [Micromonospora sp. 4G55]